MSLPRLLALAMMALIVATALAACSSTNDDDGSATDREDRPMAPAAEQDADDDSSTTSTSDDASESDDANESLDVGVVLSLSGPLAVYGDSSRRGIELAISDLQSESGTDFLVTFLDDEGDAETGAMRFQQHIDSGVMAILGPTLSNTAFSAHPVAQENEVPVLAISNTAAGITDIGDFIFRVSLSEAAVVPQTVDLIADAWQPLTAALVYSQDDTWSVSSADSFRAAAESHGIEIVIEQDIPSDGDDFQEQVVAIGDAQPDVILLSALESASIGFVTQARDYGLDQNIACGNGCNSGNFIDAAGDSAEGLVVGSAWHISIDSDESQGFVERYREMYGTDPDQFAAQSYAGIQILAEATRVAASSDREAVRDALADLGTIETVLGTFSFDDSRDGGHPAVIKIVQDGDFVLFGK